MAEDLARFLAERRTNMAPIDAGRMGRQRHARLQAELARQGVEAALLLHGPNVTYATGQAVRGVDVSYATFERPVALVVAGEDRPHLLA
ncbi:MAG: aminopeptidase P family N-terminal domain-containing protein, partial [Acidimicrobiia bacterium]